MALGNSSWQAGGWRASLQRDPGRGRGWWLRMKGGSRVGTSGGVGPPRWPAPKPLAAWTRYQVGWAATAALSCQAADALQTMRFCSTCAWTSPLFAMSSQQVSSQGHRRPGPRVLNGGPRAGDAGSGQ